jgi:uncharacterized protein (DUF1778 family)
VEHRLGGRHVDFGVRLEHVVLVTADGAEDMSGHDIALWRRPRGGARAGGLHPPARVNFRVAPADDLLLRQAADLLGESPSEFLIESGRERAERLVADRTRFVLDEASWTAFNDALDRPAEVKPEFRELFARSRPEWWALVRDPEPLGAGHALTVSTVASHPWTSGSPSTRAAQSPADRHECSSRSTRSNSLVVHALDDTARSTAGFEPATAD